MTFFSQQKGGRGLLLALLLSLTPAAGEEEKEPLSPQETLLRGEPQSMSQEAPSEEPDSPESLSKRRSIEALAQSVLSGSLPLTERIRDAVKLGRLHSPEEAAFLLSHKTGGQSLAFQLLQAALESDKPLRREILMALKKFYPHGMDPSGFSFNPLAGQQEPETPFNHDRTVMDLASIMDLSSLLFFAVSQWTPHWARLDLTHYLEQATVRRPLSFDEGKPLMQAVYSHSIASQDIAVRLLSRFPLSEELQRDLITALSSKRKPTRDSALRIFRLAYLSPSTREALSRFASDRAHDLEAREGALRAAHRYGPPNLGRSLRLQLFKCRLFFRGLTEEEKEPDIF